jgi:glycosyltransferase involved in cell wall biosynthesis
MEITLLPPQDQIPQIYARCDAWLFSSRSEGFGLPILEAMACGTPVIGTPAGVAPSLIGEGGGVLVPMDDPEAMADAIVKVVGLVDSEWKAMSDAALATARRNTWESSIDKFEAALEAAARGGRRRAQPPHRAIDSAPAAATPQGLELVGAND